VNVEEPPASVERRSLPEVDPVLAMVTSLMIVSMESVSELLESEPS